MNPINWFCFTVIAIINIPLYLYIGKMFFDDWDGFIDDVKFWFTPEIISAFRGEYWNDVFAEFKLFVYFLCCGLIVFAEYHLIMKLFFLIKNYL